MKVILEKDIRGLGRKGEVKEVSEGYARNFLLRQKLAIQGTTEKLEKISRAQKEKDILRVTHYEKQKSDSEKIKSLTLSFVRRVGEHGELFGSVSAHDIETELYAQGFQGIHAVLPHALKHEGTHKIPIDCSEGITSAVTVVIVREE